MFCCWCLFPFFSPRNLRSPLARRSSPNLATRSMVTRFIKKNFQKFLGPLPPKFGGPKTWNFGALLDNFATWSRMSPERNKTSSIEKRPCKHSRRGELNFVYYGPQTSKNRTGVLTHPPAIVQRTGVNKSVAFARGQHAHPTGGHHAGHATHLVTTVHRQHVSTC